MSGMSRSEEVGGVEGGYRDFFGVASVQLDRLLISCLVVVLVHIPSIFPWASCLLFDII